MAGPLSRWMINIISLRSISHKTNHDFASRMTLDGRLDLVSSPKIDALFQNWLTLFSHVLIAHRCPFTKSSAGSYFFLSIAISFSFRLIFETYSTFWSILFELGKCWLLVLKGCVIAKNCYAKLRKAIWT